MLYYSSFLVSTLSIRCWAALKNGIIISSERMTILRPRKNAKIPRSAEEAGRETRGRHSDKVTQQNYLVLVPYDPPGSGKTFYGWSLLYGPPIFVLRVLPLRFLELVENKGLITWHYR